MSQTVITSAFEQLKAQEAANGGIVVLDEFVFANVPDLDITSPIDRSEGLPDAAQIVHRQAVGKTGMVNNNAVVYSVVMGADVGDFDFNWVGLVNKASQVVAMIVHAPTQKKIKTASGKQGNVLTRSFLMEYNGASEQTQIVTPADTWQIDFTARLNGVDERIRRENMDIYGDASFSGDGFLVVASGGKFTVKSGVGYVAGIRAELRFDQNISTDSLPTKVWVDVTWRGTLTSVWADAVKISVAKTLSNYVDNDEQHYVYAIAEINSDGAITDLRKISNNLIEYTGLSKTDGFRWIGKAKSFSELKKILPLYQGQHILLSSFYDGWEAEGKTPIGGGEFVALRGDVEDIPGQIAIVGDGWYWQRLTRVIKISDCGLRKTKRSNVTSLMGEIYDVSEELQKIINFANVNKLPLEADDYDPANPGFEGEGYYITEGLSLEYLSASDPSNDKYTYTGLKNVLGNLVILVNSNTLNPVMTPEGGFVLTNRCATFNGAGKLYRGTLNTACFADRITVRDCSTSGSVPGRAKKVSAILWLSLGFSYTQLTAYGFDGHGVRVFAYDGIAQSTRAEHCGNIDKFAIFSSTYPFADEADESNAITFEEILAHDSYEKSWYIAGSKTSLKRFHDEALTCTVSNPPDPLGIETRNGYGYTSAYFSSVGGQLGTGSFSTFKNATVTPVITLGIVSNNVGTVVTRNARVSVISGDPGPEGGTINTLSNIGGEIRILAGARVTIGYSRSDVLHLLDVDSKVENGGANTTVCYGRLEKFNSGSLTVNTSGYIDGGSCDSLNINANGLNAVNIDKLRCQGDAVISSMKYRSFIKNSWILGTVSSPDNSVYDIENCTIHILELGGKSGLNVNLKGGVFDRATISPGVFLDPVPSFNISLTGFNVPSGGGAIGRKTTDPNTGNTYMCLGGTVWRKITYS